MKLDEQELSRAMGEAVGDVRPATRALVEAATRRGRRFRSRRRLAAGAAACAIAAVVAGTSAFGAYLPTYTGGVETLPGATDGGPGKVVIPDFSKLPKDPQPPAGKERRSGRATTQTLKELLPGSPGTSEHAGQDSVLQVYQTFGRLTMDTWVAGSEVQINFQPGFGWSGWSKTDPDRSLEGFYSCKHRRPEGKMTACGVTNLDDGSVLMLYEDRSGLLVRRHADLLRADGTRVVVGTANGADIEDGPVIGLEPPLTLKELRNIVTSPRWELFVDPEVNERAKDLTPYDDQSQDV